jgi:hypothetical protein
MITLRESLIAILALASIAVLTALGQWLASAAPEFLATWRFVNGAIILFVLIIILMKWETVRGDLHEHRRELTGIFLRMETYLRDSEARRNAEVEAVANEAKTLAAAVAEHAERASKQRHD